MSLSRAERRIAVLGATRLALFRRRRGGLELLGGAEYGQAEGPAWSGAAEALERLLGEQECGRGSLSLVLSSRFVRFALIPWSEALGAPEELEAYARFRFQEIYGALADDWLLRLSPAPAGQPRLAAAIERGLLERLRLALQDAGLRLRSVQPYLMAAFNRFAGQLPADDFLFVLAEPGRSSLLLARAGEWLCMRSLSGSADDAALLALVERECELQGLRDTARYLHAPGRTAPPPAGLQALELPCASPDTLQAMAMTVS
ncbi:hypothetical protein ACFS3C_14900 [Azotobacter vinelandii]|uniref:hypothetical protein n=1 Tax=Azotobacter TaxID=352 RepID=UPI00005277BD|nr:hypothetical protein [Azotobacter vinelandii]GLK58999.1 hypothetical protein GCM10017624_11560 [Azotobacter vinelandii]SFX51290.1 hypothetical protein SAMN04244547_01811 [Azotobacter vinelandii]